MGSPLREDQDLRTAAAWGIRHQLDLQGVSVHGLDLDAIAAAALAKMAPTGLVLHRSEHKAFVASEREATSRWQRAWISVTDELDRYRLKVQYALEDHPELAEACGVMPVGEPSDSGTAS